MGSKSIVGKSVILGAKVKETLAGFEEDLYISSLSIDPDDIFLAQGHIRTDQAQPVFPVYTVSDTDNPGIDRCSGQVFL